MSLFFEDEIQKAMERADDLELENFMALDPRRNQRRASKNHSISRNGRLIEGNQRNSRNRSNRRRNREN
ncbi:hypothetical protein [Sporosarcina limicola]|uniref:Uncharacterized protein n=1 Tax=Sporosarcina limicola TaxID=34101 RepID=A0A927MP42_9BACL|nr:hypothetical protein [Sporosarcina limicola]MBE1554994.1 hypothetical protein [Sporosarcina limicola]